MCSRYGAATEFNLIEKTYHISLPEIVVLPQEIIYPQRPAPVLLEVDKKLDLRLMNYSLIPSWSKVRKPKFATYNARIEEVLRKPSWKEPFKSRHCLVPMQFFIESVYEGPYAGHNISIEAQDHRILTAAGIWDRWVDKNSGEVIESFAILTTQPSAQILEAGHDRSPIFLKEEAWNSWVLEKHAGTEWLDFLDSNRDEIHFSFTEKEALKSYQPQLSLFEED